YSISARFPEADAVSNSRPSGLPGQRLEQRVVDGDNTLGGSLEDLRLGGDDSLLRFETLQMHRADRDDRSNRGFDPATEIGDLARTVSAHLGDEDLGPGHEVVIDRPGQSHSVVEG